jgi:hypothetical protein
MTEEEFWAALAPVVAPPAPIYRLYYDDLGNPLFYSMEELPGNYIEIDFETWTNPGHVRVVDGQLVKIKTATVRKLVPGNIGTSCHPDDIAVVVDASQTNTKWSLK